MEHKLTIDVYSVLGLALRILELKNKKPSEYAFFLEGNTGGARLVGPNKKRNDKLTKGN